MECGPDEIWRSAYVDYTAGLYDLAVQEFSEFQSKFPTDPRAGEAQLYKGNALYAQKKYEPAIVEYDMFLQKYPENVNTKTALLKKGLAQADNNDVKGATATLQQVVKQFPRTVEATNADQARGGGTVANEDTPLIRRHGQREYPTGTLAGEHIIPRFK